MKLAIPILLGLSFVLTACGENSGANAATPTPTVARATAGPYEAPLSSRLETPDGALTIYGPEGWPALTAVGYLRIAPTEGALLDTGIPSAARLTLTVATGPLRAQDFHLEGSTPRAIYAYFSLYPESRAGRPSEATDLPWPAVEGHSSSTREGEQHLWVLTIDDQTAIAVQAFAPIGEWDRFGPMVRGMLATLEVN